MTNETGANGGSWLEWHTEKQNVDMVVSAAINEKSGGDYAKAADAIRTSNRPAAVKQFEVGQLIVSGILENAPRRPPESLEDGLRMMEDSTIASGQKDLSAIQQLRSLFEYGDTTLPRKFLPDHPVAACWLDIEERRSNDPARCIALRRQRTPHAVG